MADRTVTYSFVGQFSSLRAGLAAAGRDVQAFGTQLTALDAKGAKMRSGLTTIGSAAGKIGLVAAVGLGAAIKSAADFDQAMSNIQAATHETAGNMDLLREAALQAGADTAFSATEAAAAIENLAKAGVSTKDILDGGLTGALDLAAAGGLDVATAAEQAATAMTQFGLSGADVPHIADLLAAAAGKAQGEVTDMGAALNQSGLIADQVGLSIEETTGALASFASAGLLGSDAGTSFKTMLGALTPNSAKAREEMERLGISAYDAQGNFIGLTDFAGNLQSALADMTDEQRQATLETIFGSDAVRAASILYEQGADGIQKWIDKVDDQGYAAETAATKMDNLKGDLEALGGSLETALIGTGTGSQGPLRSLVQNLTGLVNAYNDLPGPIKTATGALSGFAALMGGGIWLGSKIVRGITDTRQALADLGVQAPRTSRALTAVGATAGRLFVVAAALSAVGEATAKIAGTDLSQSDMQRNLEALARGEVVDNMGRIGEDLAIVNDNLISLGEPIQETIRGFGLFGDTGLDKAQANLEGIDQTLAAMVESGNAQQATDAFDQIVWQAQQAGIGYDDVRKQFNGFSTALDNYIASGSGAADASEDAADGVDDLGNSAQEAAPKLTAAEKAARDAAAGFLDYSDSIVQGKFSLDKYLDALEKQLRAQEAFDRNIQTLRDRGLDDTVIDELIKQGPAAAQAVAGLANGTDAAIDRMNAAVHRGSANVRNFGEDTVRELKGAKAAFDTLPKRVQTDIRANNIPQTESQIAALQKKYNLTPDQVKTIALLSDLATPKIQAVMRALAAADGKVAKTTIITEHIDQYRVYGAHGVTPGDSINRATGGYVAGPGTSTSDSIPARLSNGEFVVNAAATARLRPWLEYENAKGFAAGGYNGTSAGPTTWANISPWALMARATQDATSTIQEWGHELHTSSLTQRDLRKIELQDRKRHLSELLKLQEKERDAIKERLDALRQERQSLVEGVASIVAAGHDLLGGVRTAVIPGLGSTDEISFADGPATFASFSAALNAQFGTAAELKHVLAVFKRKHLGSELLQWLITNGADIATLEDFASQSAADLQAISAQFSQVNQFTHAVGNQAFGVAGGAAEMRQVHKSLDAVNAAIRDLHETEKRIDKKLDHLKHLDETGPERTGRAVADAEKQSRQERSRTASRRATR